MTKYPNAKDIDINRSTTRKKPWGRDRIVAGLDKSDAESTPKQKRERRQRSRREKEAR
jgi:hypothetical protein